MHICKHLIHRRRLAIVYAASKRSDTASPFSPFAAISAFYGTANASIETSTDSYVPTLVHGTESVSVQSVLAKQSVATAVRLRRRRIQVISVHLLVTLST